MSSISNANNAILQSQLQSVQLNQQIGVKVAAKAMDVTRAEGQAALDLLDSAMQVAKECNKGPITVGQLVSGLGQNLDVSA